MYRYKESDERILFCQLCVLHLVRYWQHMAYYSTSLLQSPLKKKKIIPPYLVGNKSAGQIQNINTYNLIMQYIP